MDDLDKKRFLEIMTGLAENFSAKVSAQGLRLSFAVLKCYAVEQVEAAAIRIMAKRISLGMPTVAEFIEEIEGSGNDKAQFQVNEIVKQIRMVGSYGTPVFDDMITRDLMDSRWSFRSLCAMTETELKWWARDFAEAYQSMNRTGKTVQIECGEAQNRRLKLLAGGIG
jgi:hypothetical protein